MILRDINACYEWKQYKVKHLLFMGDLQPGVLTKLIHLYSNMCVQRGLNFGVLFSTEGRS